MKKNKDNNIIKITKIDKEENKLKKGKINMGNIVLLDELTINQMAAGEVIERPANVVKELVENSIDAGATSIIVEVKNGGKTFIKVTDNGSGIEKDDMLISLERHATSKIRKVEDIEKIYSMGFRGEALASIASVSKLTMISKTKDMDVGNIITITGGNIEKQEQIGTQTGTTIIVEDLFYNTPVRYKFLKQDASEYRYIKEWIQKVALANPAISFRLVNDYKTEFVLNGNGDIQNVVYLLYGKEITDNLIKVDYAEDDIKVTGVIGNTLIAKDSRKEQIFFLNKRNIRNPIITNAADQAFKGATGIGKYGFFILNIEMPADAYDINVHPTKMEVRFKEESRVYKTIYHAIKSTMLNSEFLGNKEETEKNQYIENEYKFLVEDEKTENNENLIQREERKVEYKYLGIIFKTYIIIEVENELYLVDQHAAHERLLYEQIKANYKNNISRNSQMMLIPEVIDLQHKEMEFVKENIQLFKNVGFEIEEFGENSVKINGIPDLEYRSKTKNIFMDILDEMILNERTSIKDVEERFIATVACKAAVKAGMDLTKEEVDNLIQNLLRLNNPYTCPHGRPTTIKIGKEYLEKFSK